MNDELLTTDFGQTPIAPDDLVGLRDTSIATRAELDTSEQANITRGRRRWHARPPAPDVLLDPTTLRRLHHDLFGDVWDWAGSYRQRLVSVTPVDPTEIATLLLDRCRDTIAQLQHSTDLDGVAARLHHSLTWIHPFPNGNGRWARETTDLLLETTGQQAFTWGRGQLRAGGTATEVRNAYIAALRSADGHDDQPLLDFCRT